MSSMETSKKCINCQSIKTWDQLSKYIQVEDVMHYLCHSCDETNQVCTSCGIGKPLIEGFRIHTRIIKSANDAASGTTEPYFTRVCKACDPSGVDDYAFLDNNTISDPELRLERFAAQEEPAIFASEDVNPDNWFEHTDDMTTDKKVSADEVNKQQLRKDRLAKSKKFGLFNNSPESQQLFARAGNNVRNTAQSILASSQSLMSNKASTKAATTSKANTGKKAATKASSALGKFAIATSAAAAAAIKTATSTTSNTNTTATKAAATSLSSDAVQSIQTDVTAKVNTQQTTTKTSYQQQNSTNAASVAKTMFTNTNPHTTVDGKAAAMHVAKAMGEQGKLSGTRLFGNRTGSQKAAPVQQQTQQSTNQSTMRPKSSPAA